MTDSHAARLMKKGLEGSKKKRVFQIGTSNLLADIPYHVSTGIWPVDAVLGQGLPGGRLIELFGEEQSGKSMLALLVIACVQQAGGTALMMDAEGTNTRDFMQAMGVDLGNLIVCNPVTIEEAYEMVDQYLTAKVALDKELGDVIPGVIVWDTIAATTSEKELKAIEKGGLGQHVVAPHASALSRMLRHVPGRLSSSGVTALFLNQTRQKIGVMFGEQEQTAGGRAMLYYPSVRIKLTPRGSFKRGQQIVGFNVRMQVQKNKAGLSMGYCMFPILYSGRADNVTACLYYLKETGAISTSGSWNHINIGEELVKFQLNSWPETFMEHEEHIRRLVLEGLDVPMSEVDLDEK